MAGLEQQAWKTEHTPWSTRAGRHASPSWPLTPATSAIVADSFSKSFPKPFWHLLETCQSFITASLLTGKGSVLGFGGRGECPAWRYTGSKHGELVGGPCSAWIDPRLPAGKHAFSLLSHLSHPRALCKSFSVEAQVFSTVK